MKQKLSVFTAAVALSLSSINAFAAPQGYISLDSNNFPDNAFLSYVKEVFNTDVNDDYLSPDEIENVVSISVENKNISSLQGIENFTALKFLECFDNQITSLDLSKNIALEYLNCDNNNLLSIKLPQSTTLTVYFNGNVYSLLNENDEPASKILFSEMPGFDIQNVVSVYGAQINEDKTAFVNIGKYAYYKYLTGRTLYDRESNENVPETITCILSNTTEPVLEVVESSVVNFYNKYFKFDMISLNNDNDYAVFTAAINMLFESDADFEEKVLDPNFEQYLATPDVNSSIYSNKISNKSVQNFCLNYFIDENEFKEEYPNADFVALGEKFSIVYSAKVISAPILRVAEAEVEKIGIPVTEENIIEEVVPVEEQKDSKIIYGYFVPKSEVFELTISQPNIGDEKLSFSVKVDQNQIDVVGNRITYNIIKGKFESYEEIMNLEENLVNELCLATDGWVEHINLTQLVTNFNNIQLAEPLEKGTYTIFFMRDNDYGEDVKLIVFEVGVPNAISNINVNDTNKTIKTIKDGQIVIIRNGVMYDMQGRKL